MITYRLRGLLNLHVLVITVVAAAFFLGFARVAVHIPWILLTPGLNLVPCVIAIIAGMLIGSRSLGRLGGKFHLIGWTDAAQLTTRQIALVALMLFTLIVGTKDRSISRLFLAHYLVLGWVVLVVVNRFLPRYLGNLAFDRLHRLPTLFMGSKNSLELLNAWIVQKRHLGVTPVGFLSDDYHGGQREFLGPFLGKGAELARAIEEQGATQVVLLDVPVHKEETSRIIEVCQNQGCRLLIHDNVADRLPIPMIVVVEEGHYFLTNQDEPLEDPYNRFVKRTFDIAVSLPVVVLMLPPVYLLVWVVQRFQAPGPLLFVRPRGGRGRAEFQMLKFRSMYHAPKADREREAHQARSGDRRVYPFGAFLRKTSMDELPQFWNVLRGDMSVVGPRPHLPTHDQEFSQIAKAYRTRQLVKPGITGLAQIRGYRGEITDPAVLEKRVQQDIFYITQWSIWLDLVITAKTLVHVLRPPKTAY